ncbi:MAG: sulfotransferase [Actinomycetales bacterium]
MNSDIASPRVLYIAGSGRSGTTLLERVVGTAPGYEPVGELIDLARRVAAENELCGCSQSFADCPFWQAVGRRLAAQPGTRWRDPAWSPQNLDRLLELQRMLARQRYLPRLLIGPRSASVRTALHEYGQRYRQLYSAIAAHAGADVVVDASKWPSQALALFRAGVDVRVLHVVRDVRGVANSLSKEDVVRPQSQGDATMYSQSVASGAGRWLATQTEVDLLRTVGMKVHRLSYDDFVDAPATSLRGSLEALGLASPDFQAVAEPAGGRPTVHLEPSHGLSGNPSRFRHGDTTLRADDSWRTRLSPGQQRMAVAVALPQVVRGTLPQAIRSIAGRAR